MNLEPSAIASATANATATATTTATSSAAATGSATVSASASTRGTASASDTASASEAHVPRLNFTARYVAVSEHSRVACLNFNNNLLARCQSVFAATTPTEHTASIFSTFKPRVLRPL